MDHVEATTQPTTSTAPPIPTAAFPILTRPTGLGTSAARIGVAAAPGGGGDRRPADPAGTADQSAAKSSDKPSDHVTVPQLYCPPALRDDPALGDEIDERLVAWWGGEIGAQPGELDKLRKCGFGRLTMLAHPDCDDPDRLTAAAKCAVAEWAVDDFYLDGDAAESEPGRIGPRLASAYAAMAPARLPPMPYTLQYEQVVQGDPVLRAIRSSWTNLARFASTTQVFRLRHELAVMFVAYNQEAEWHVSGRTPPVWEFLMHRWENAFCPTMVLTDPLGGYEVPVHEFYDPRVRRVFTSAGVASVLVNDLYSLDKEARTNKLDFSLPRVLMNEEGCTLQEAVDKTAAMHDQLMHFVEAESAALAAQGSPMLGRFLAGVWNWMGGGKEWHATSRRYHAAPGD
jgi:2-methylisoborneol synthase